MKRTYWTPDRDEELKRHEAAGLSTARIAALLHTTRSAVIGRSNRLRGNLFRSDVERLKRHPHQGTFFAAMGANPYKHEVIIAALRADLAAGVDRNVVVKRALGAGLKRATVGEFFGLSIEQVFQIAGPRQGARRWTKEQVELLLSMWPDHSTAEIAAALGTNTRAVSAKLFRMGLRKSRRRTSVPDHFPPRASAARTPPPRFRDGRLAQRAVLHGVGKERQRPRPFEPAASTASASHSASSSASGRCASATWHQCIIGTQISDILDKARTSRPSRNRTAGDLCPIDFVRIPADAQSWPP